MLGKREQRYDPQGVYEPPMPRYTHPPPNLNPKPLVATKFRFREHYIKNLSVQPIDLAELSIRPVETQALELPGRGSLSRLSFWASRRTSKEGEVAYFKCTLPENNPVPVTKELLKNALEGLARNQRSLKIQQHKQFYYPPEPRTKTAEVLERLNNEMTLEHQKMQAQKQVLPPVQTMNAEVKLPSPSNRETVKVKRRMKSQAQYKFKDFEGSLNNLTGKTKGDSEKPGDNRSPEQGTEDSQVAKGREQHQSKEGSHETVSLSGSYKQDEQEPLESDLADPKQKHSRTVNNDQQRRKGTQTQDKTNDSQQSLSDGDDAQSSQQGSENSLERGDSNQQRRRKQRTKWTKKKYAREVDVTEWKPKYAPNQIGRMVTRRHLKGLPVAVLRKKPRIKKPKPEVTQSNAEELKMVSSFPASGAKNLLQIPGEGNVVSNTSQQFIGPQVKHPSVVKSASDSPAKLIITEILAANQRPQAAPTATPTTIQRSNQSKPQQPQKKTYTPQVMSNQRMVTPSGPEKSAIFDQNSAKYLSIFKPRELAAPEPSAMKQQQQVVMAEATQDADEEPYIVPQQNLPICDPNLRICSVFDYNAQISNFTGHNERNKLSYQESYQHYLAQIFRSGDPVCSIEYKFKGETIHRYDQKVLQMIKSLFDSNTAGNESLTKIVESVIKHTDTITFEHPSFEFPIGGSGSQNANSNELHPTGVSLNYSYHLAHVQQQSSTAEQEIASKELELALNRNAFRYVLIRFSLDKDLRLEDLSRLDNQELHMLVAFFNVKFGISDTADRLFPNDPVERILTIANKYINRVLHRTQNFKKNEEFLKKKWKEFLKFVKAVFKDESGTGNLASKGKIVDYKDANKPHVNRLIYEKYHRKCVLKKMHEYNNDVAKFRRFEWSVNEEIKWPSPDLETSEMNKLYSDTEIQFMRVFFSVKA